jgi:hypothetical protein
MMKTASRMMMAAAAATMAIAPVAAQANTRAGDSGSVYSVSAPGLGRSDKGESLTSGASIILGLLGFAAFVAGVYLATESDDKGQSPGT